MAPAVLAYPVGPFPTFLESERSTFTVHAEVRAAIQRCTGWNFSNTSLSAVSQKLEAALASPHSALKILAELEPIAGARLGP